ncbi:cytochrome D1 domain-containing protein [Pseudomonas aeruginosa]|nr:cytochrome D1 domain-containing protein [Pseudomonas aeruginosa]
MLDARDWKQTDAIDVAGQPVFVMTRPDDRQIWVNFAYPDNDKVQVIDSETHEVIETLRPGPGVLHMEFAGAATRSGSRCATPTSCRSGTRTA